MSFIIYDLILLGIFLIAIAGFLYRKRKNLKREGLLFLYKTEWGIKLINKVGNKYQRTMKVLSHVSVWLGYILMAGMLWLFYTLVKVYVSRPDVVDQIKVPPIMPLIPYIDKFVPFLPPFYFTYWIVILAIVAISHEFAHGIFAAYNKVGIKKTGFGFFPFFLPVFLAAFVELDEKKMVKKKNFSQRAVLSAGTFANIVTAAVFLVIIWIFFSLSFGPAGVVFDDYSYYAVPIASITMINGINLESPSYDQLEGIVKDAEFNNITAGGANYVGVKGFSDDKTQAALYNDAPAINARLNGAILEINGEKIKSVEELGTELAKYEPGEEITITTKDKEGVKEHTIILGEHPEKAGEPWLGIGFVETGNSIFSKLSSFRNQHIYYESMIGEFGEFIYQLLWWLIIISVSIALVNMLPVGLFDGGRFFYLTILAITKNEAKARKSFKFMTWLFLFLLFVIMVFWLYAILF